jgi:hypothetical protein
MPLLLRFLLVLVLATSAHAADINVSAGDAAGLVNAITTANGNGQDDVIILAAGSTYTYTAANNGSNALPVVTSKITIQGNGAFIERQAGSPEFRLIDVGDSGDLTLDRVTVRGGQVTVASAPPPVFTDGGGGIRLYGLGKLTLTNSTVTHNRCEGAVCQGGGIMVYPLGANFSPTGALVGNAEATLTDSIVSENFGDSGGGIALRDSNQILTLIRTTVKDNDAGGGGGAGLITNGADRVTITDSTFSANAAADPDGAYGGGILDNSGSTFTISGSTFNGNSASANRAGGSTVAAGGAFVETGGAIVSIVNSTFTGNTVSNPNTAFANGAALHSEGGGSWTLNNVTITGNTASGTAASGGGIDATLGDFTIRNSIISGNAAPVAADCQFAGDQLSNVTSQGHNIIGTTAGCNVTTTTGDQVGADPLLGNLTDHGGPTQTMALLAGSAAIDKGDPGTPGSGGTTCEAVDQRGVTRPQGTACDIGAFEAGGEPTTTTTIPTGVCGTRAPTYESIDCRLDALIAQLDAATNLGKVKPALLRSSMGAREKKVAAENNSSVKKQKKLLKKAIGKMRSYNFRIGSRNAHRQITDEALRMDLDTQGAEIIADLKTLMKSL